MDYSAIQGKLWNVLEEIRTTEKKNYFVSVTSDYLFIKLYFNRFESFVYL